MHNLMSESDISRSPCCIYCGHRVTAKDWQNVWDGHAQYVEVDCPDCTRAVFFKMGTPKVERDDERPSSALEVKIREIDAWNAER